MKNLKLLILTLFLCMAVGPPVAQATLTMTLDITTVNIGDIVVITISSDAAIESDWGVYLEPVSVYPSDAQLQNPMVLTDAGINGAVTAGTDPGDGHDYYAGPGGGKPANRVKVGDWSTVEFVGLTAGNYSIDMFDYTKNGGDCDAPGTPEDTQTITVIPEPATIMLLGLGGLLLRRKRRP